MRGLRRWSKWIVLVLVMLELGHIVSSGNADTRTESAPVFFEALQDVPVMPGLVELEGQSFSFDKPEGEITEAVAALGDLREDQVLYFYQVTLPQFGWGKVSDAEFFRKNEQLEISFEKNQDGHLVKIMIRPTR
tara:strand:- start:8018 stop:8419 length:402 start_codon:yes stop_codon:yes gene_type:complete